MAELAWQQIKTAPAFIMALAQFPPRLGQHVVRTHTCPDGEIACIWFDALRREATHWRVISPPGSS